MSFTLHLSNLSAEQMLFAYSPAHEAIVALHVLTDPKHHPLHISWVIEARRRMSSGLKEEIEKFRFLYNRPIVEFWEMTEDTSIQTFSEALNDIKEKPIEFYIKQVMETLLDQKVEEKELASFQDAFLVRMQKRYPSSQETISHFVEKPKENRERFLLMLAEFWEACLKKDWPGIEAKFLEDIKNRGKTLLTEGPIDVLKGLAPEIDIDPNEKKAVLRRISKGDFYFEEGDRLCLAPSYFSWPHLFFRSEKPIGINYPIMEKQREAKSPLPNEDVMKFLRAMGEMTRYQILEFLSKQSRSTRELAGLIGITESAVSKHLKKLEDAGLVSSKRESYYVFYVLNKDRIKAFQKSLSSLIY